MKIILKNLYRLLYHLTFNRCKSFYCKYKQAYIQNTNKLMLIDKYGNKKIQKFTKYIEGLNFSIMGNRNVVILHESSQYHNVNIFIKGNDNFVKISENVCLYNSNITIGDSDITNSKFLIGKNTYVNGMDVRLYEDSSFI